MGVDEGTHRRGIGRGEFSQHPTDTRLREPLWIDHVARARVENELPTAGERVLGTTHQIHERDDGRSPTPQPGRGIPSGDDPGGGFAMPLDERPEDTHAEPVAGVPVSNVAFVEPCGDRRQIARGIQPVKRLVL